MAFLDFLNQTSYSFEGKKDDEVVALFLHRHWFTIINKFIFLVIGTLFPFAIFIVFSQVLIGNNLVPLFVLAWSILVMILWLIFFYSLMIYTLDTWLVTNMRIINSVQCGFFERRVSELSISNIQDVSIKIEGLMATTLNYGDIEVQTAGGDHHFTFEEIPNPQQVKDAIIHVVDEYKAKHPGGTSL